MDKSKDLRRGFFIVSTMIFLAALSRLLPHPPNFTPLVAVSLFGASKLNKFWQALIVPISALLVSDLFLGFHSLMWAVYGAFFLISCFGYLLLKKESLTKDFAVVALSSLFFFFFTNTAVWVQSSQYSHDSSGFLLCLTVALPFFRNALIGDLFYSVILFGAYRLIEVKFFKTYKFKSILSGRNSA